MLTDSFRTEIGVYEKNRDQWLGQGLDGCFAVIKGDKVIATTPTYEEAVRVGIEKTRSREFFIQRIQPADTVEWLSHIA